MKFSAKMSSKGSKTIKAPKSPLGSSSRSPSSFGGASPLGSKKNYAKSKGAAADQFGQISFGATGTTGRD